MNITVKVDDVSLDTAIASVVEYDPETGGTYSEGNATIGDIVARQIVDRLRQDREGWDGLSTRFREVRDEMIREACRPLIEEAITAPIARTNSYGETTGQSTTLRELIMDQAQKALTAPTGDSYARDRRPFIEKVVSEQVQKALGDQIQAAVKLAREQVSDEIGNQVAAAVKAGLKAR